MDKISLKLDNNEGNFNQTWSNEALKSVADCCFILSISGAGVTSNLEGLLVFNFSFSFFFLSSSSRTLKPFENPIRYTKKKLQIKNDYRLKIQIYK